MPLHALLIGINNYHPDSNVPGLLGCANDVAAMSEFLEQQFSEGERTIVKLLNEAATYDNIMAHFGTEHLLKAKKGDTVFIHFSGHGARGFSAPEFKSYYPDGMDENLVCYDSRLSGKSDLADKELAVLIERLAEKEADVIVLLDCCHSGSGTRSSEDLKIAASRQWEDREEQRAIESYCNGHYVSNLYIPNASHLLLAACEKKQKAFELSNNRGVFTTSLLAILNEKNAKISYAELFEETRTRMRLISKEQSPQFESFGAFNVHRHFLKSEEETPKRHRLLHQKGSIPKPPIAVAVHLEEGRFLNNDATKAGYSEGLKKALQKDKPIYFELCAENNAAPFQLHIHSKGLTLIQSVDQTVLGKLPDKDQFAFKSIFERLEHLCRFEETRDLGKEITIKNDDVKLLLNIVDDNGVVVREIKEAISTIELQKNDGLIQKVEYRVAAENNCKKAKHLCLLHFNQNYGVQAVYNEEIPGEATVVMMERNERSKSYNFDLKKKAKAKEYFKLIVSNKKIDGHLLEQEDLKIETLRGTGKRKKKGAEAVEHWYALDVEVGLTCA